MRQARRLSGFAISYEPATAPTSSESKPSISLLIQSGFAMQSESVNAAISLLDSMKPRFLAEAGPLFF